jgi:hypothetical protein
MNDQGKVRRTALLTPNQPGPGLVTYEGKATRDNDLGNCKNRSPLPLRCPQ